MIGVSCRSLGEKADQVFRQFEEVSGSQPLVLMGNLNVFDICWKSDKVDANKGGHFRINFLKQALEGPNRCDT